MHAALRGRKVGVLMPRGRKKLSPIQAVLANPVALIAAGIVLLALILLLVLHPWSRTAEDAAVSGTDPTVSATDAPQESAAPEDESTATPAPTAALSESRLTVPEEVDLSNAILPKIANGYLPVFEGIETDKKQIAITVDDLWQDENVLKILSVCEQTGAKLTFFPIGEAVEDNPDLIRKIYEGGHEIENHTYSHVNLYSLSAKEMCAELLKQNLVINEALGLDYQMHFLRPRGGNSDYDKRMHNMLSQMGYVGVSHWNLSGTPDMSTWTSKLKSGDVMLFHATDNDAAKLVKLIPKLVELGYELVTLNDLYGLPANATYELGSTTIGTMEGLDLDAMEADVPYSMLKEGDASFAVRRLQLRLSELGFYSTECDGEYGSGTVTAVKAFQTAAGLEVDGIAGTATQDALFADNAPVAAK